MKKWLFLLLLALTLSFHSTSMATEKDVSSISIALQDPLEITGQITDTLGAPLPGVTIRLRSGIETTTDQNGRYVLAIPNEFVKDAVLTFSMVGFTQQQITVAGQTKIDVRLAEASNLIGETVVTAFGQRARKEDVVGAITTVNPSDLKIPSSNLTTALAGRVAGIIGFQRTGEPGADNAEFFIRGVTSFGYNQGPLVLIDNIESTTTDLARMQVDDIESFSVLKDASAAALYGARGANGVILITTKEGRRESMNLFVRVENSLSTPTREVDVVDPITYMKLANDAILSRMPGQGTVYSQRKIEYTPPGGSLEYPAVNWRDELINDFAMNQRVNMNIRGGGSIAQYFVSGAFNQDNGILKVPKVSNFNNNVNLRTYNLLSNVSINLTDRTQMKVRLSGTFDDYNGPLQSATKVYRDVMRAVPTSFMPYYPPGENYKFLNHIMFGNSYTSDEPSYLNPYAEMVKGYREYFRSRMQAQVELNQKLDFLTEGLSFTGRVTTTRYAYNELRRSYVPFWYQYMGVDQNGNNLYNPLNADSGNETLGYTQGTKDITSIFFLQGIANYNRKFGEHSLTGMLVGTMNSEQEGNAGSLQLSLPHRNIGLAGRLAYGYLGKYHLEANFGYNGSERFSTVHRFGFFPSAGAAWHVSKENFFEPLTPVVSNLRLRATYGLVGNDAIGSASQRFYYLSEVNTDAARGWTFGPSMDENLAGINVSRYPNAEISWETASKTNLALELGLFNNAFELQADWFTEKRKSIFMERADIPATMGLSALIHANIGEASASGIDLQGTYKKSWYNGLWLQGMMNFTYSTNKYIVYEEPAYPHPWLFRAGYPIRVQRGYIAEKLFSDEAEIRNSPEQQLGGEVIPGDIKYMDVNGDGIISTLDQVPLGYPTVPEINYGFALSGGFKGFDFNVLFTGLARETFFIDPAATGPFRNYVYVDNGVVETVNGRMRNNVLQVYADDHWSLDNRDPYALFPRLGWESGAPNNEVTSTWWMRDGSFMRLKSAEIGYTFNKDKGILANIGVKNLRAYVSGSNLLTFSKFKLWDVEMADRGMNYPIQRVFNLGVKVDF
ncbi:TonB-dependent receptor [Sphingobacterium olei]|uniref:TonB-dependent receptor n=1 Tax=Sphingobacterium olei TaxID=2571155 RepID=A0A4U0P3R6_9SPHI|nr:TonB-dependent receptor [Sphingobacterium olei]TJZ62006.1 TonB-dependent receptor [Sphingobacterium olei]